MEDLQGLPRIAFREPFPDHRKPLRGNPRGRSGAGLGQGIGGVGFGEMAEGGTLEFPFELARGAGSREFGEHFRGLALQGAEEGLP